MNALEIKDNLLSKKLLCSFFGHNLVIKRNVTPNFREFECTNCHLELTNNVKGEKIFLTPHLKDVNETLFNFYNKRHHLV